MIEAPNPAETPPVYDTFHQRLVEVFQDSRNGQSVLEWARSMIRGYYRDLGRRGDISLIDPVTEDMKLPLANVPDNAREEILGLAATGEPPKPESQEYLRANFAEGKALVRCVTSAYTKAHA